MNVFSLLFSPHLAERDRAQDRIFFLRKMTLVGALVYLMWWPLVELTLPGSFNPFLGRFLVVLYFFLVYFLSYVSNWFRRHLTFLFNSAVWILTSHYYYLVYFNSHSHLPLWIAGTFITLVAINSCLQTRKELYSYAVFTLILTILEEGLGHRLLQSIFLPGVFTIHFLTIITHHKRMKLLEDLEKSTQRFFQLFNATFEGIIVHDQGRILEANQAFCEIMGHSHEEVLRMPLSQLIKEEFPFSDLDKKNINDNRTHKVSGIKKNGTTADLEMSGKDFFISGKKLKLLAFQDIGIWKKMEEEKILLKAVEKSIRMRDEFLSIASHELKTPLTSLKLNIQLRLRNLKNGKWGNPSTEQIENIFKEDLKRVDRMANLINDMLDVSLISLEKVPLNKEKVDLCQLVRDILAQFEKNLSNAGYQYQLEVCPPLIGEWDYKKIEQVFTNLLTNAIKYGNQRPLFISVKRDLDMAVLVVKDQGIGISLPDQKRIFEKFERVESTLGAWGLGLGLFISNYIVKSHGGTIEVESQKGEGATFSVKLPLKNGNIPSDSD